MSRNIEIKARMGDWETGLRAARSVATADLGELHQIDTYLRVAKGRGRLKLRQFGAGPAELISYFRADERDAKVCDYRVVPIDDAEGILAALTATLGVLVRVEKRRLIYLCENVRIHLDRVKGLGEFIEFEAVVDAAHDEARCYETIARLQKVFGIRASDLLIGSYSDMIAEESGR